MHLTLAPLQQRRVLRRAVTVDCQVVREHDFKLVGRRALDVSTGGMLVMLERPVLTGEPLLVALRLPRGGGWVDAEGTVTRVLHGRRPGDQGRCFALCFDALPAGQGAALSRALRGVPPPLPMRAPRIDYAGSVALAARS